MVYTKLSKEQLEEIKSKYPTLVLMDDDIADAFNMVSDILTAEADAIKEKEPYEPVMLNFRADIIDTVIRIICVAAIGYIAFSLDFRFAVAPPLSSAGLRRAPISDSRRGRANRSRRHRPTRASSAARPRGWESRLRCQAAWPIRRIRLRS